MIITTLTGFGGPEVLTTADVPTPEPGPDEVLLRVQAAGVNRADVLQRQGHYPPPPGTPDWPGLEAAGEIVAMGATASALNPELQVGTQACALLAGGGYAEFVVADARHVLPVPSPLTAVEAGGLMEAACTVWSNLEVADAVAGQTVLLHGGSGGVGSLAVQIAHALGLTVITTARGADRTARCLELGADVAIDYSTEDFVERTKAAGGADVVLDVMGAAYLERNLACLKPDGALVVIGMQGGVRADLSLGTLLTKRARLIGTTLRARPADQKAAIVADVREHVWPLLEAGVRPVIDRTFTLAEASEAHRALESGEVFGKVVLTVD